MSRYFKILLLVLVQIGFSWSSVSAQLEEGLAEDVRDVFEQMIEDLDPELARKFTKAIKKNSATIEFTPEQFRRFRDNPINPFDGLDAIDAVDGGGNIALKFELPSLRGRVPHPLERQHEGLRQELRSPVGSAAASVVKVFSDRKQVALGIIISADGFLITKSSEVENEDTIVVHFPSGRKLNANVVRTDKANDVALLSVDVGDSPLTPIVWKEVQPRLGSFLLTPDGDGQVAAIGTYSSPVRSTVSGEQAFLGVQPQTTEAGVLISDVRPGNASYDAGLQDGDVIYMMAGAQIRDVTDLVRLIRQRRPGDQIRIEFLRRGVKKSVDAKLASRNMTGERAARFKMMNRLGAIPSRRSDGFPGVFQHDTPLFPEQCGGPIVDLDGEVVGMNIARNGRAASYALPSRQVQSVLENLKGDNLALRADSAKVRDAQSAIRN
jgi:serine protease Do